MEALQLLDIDGITRRLTEKNRLICVDMNYEENMKIRKGVIYTHD